MNCTYGGFDDYSVFPASHTVDNWYTLNSSDYFNGTCPNSTFYNPKQNVFGNQNAKNGIAYPGFLLYGVSYETKEYIYQQLTSPLQAGKMYCLSFYVSRADRVTHAIHSIGAYFSNNVQSVAALGYVNATPQIINQSGFVTDTANWVQIQGCYTASGGEQYITIGNFNSNANTDTLKIQPVNALSTSTVDIAYYYIDDITLIDQSTVGVNELSNGTSVSVYPNPANDVLNIEFIDHPELVSGSHEMLNPPAGGQHAYKIKITDVIGRDVLVSEYKSQLDVSFLEKGIYFVSIQQDSKTLGVKKVVKEQ